MNNRRKQLMLASAKEYCKCVVEGKTLKYNQQVEDNFSNTSAWSSLGNVSYSFNNNVATITTTSSGGANWQFGIQYSFVNGGLKTHKYLVYVEIEANLNVDFIFEILGYYQTIGNNKVVCGIVDVSNIDNQYQYFAIFPNTILNVGDTYKLSKPTIIDLTELGLDSINSVADFFATDLGKYIAKGNYLHYEPNGKFIHAQSPINFKGVNMLNLSRLEGTLSGFYNTTPRDFKENEYYVGLSATNYYSSTQIVSYEAKENEIKVECSNIGYGIAFPIRVKPNTQYYFSFTTDNGYNRVGWYDENGNHIGYTSGETINRSPNNAYWAVLIFAGRRDNELVTFKDIVFCENALYQNKYEPYCNNSVIESGLTLQNGDKYKTYSVDSVEYNQLLETNSFANISSSSLLNVFNVVANHKYLFVQKYSRECEYPYEDRDYQVYFYGDNIETEYNVDVRGNFIYEPNASDTCTLRVETYSEFGTPINFSIMLIDLTALGLTNVNSVADFNKTKLGMFLSKGYYLPYTLTNKTIKDQIVRTFKEVDLSSFTWHNAAGVYCVALPKDIKINGQAIAERYANDDIWIAEYPYDDMNLVVRTNATPSGKALLELETPEFGGTSSYETISITASNLTEDEYSECYITLDKEYIGCLEIAMEGILEGFTQTPYDGDFMDIPSDAYPQQRVSYEYYNGKTYIYIIDETKQGEGNSLYSYLLGNDIEIRNYVPTCMVSRRIINVESKNGIDLDFSKE